jgi:hypothetical protein
VEGIVLDGVEREADIGDIEAVMEEVVGVVDIVEEEAAVMKDEEDGDE